MDHCLECGKAIEVRAAVCDGCGEPTSWAVPALPFDDGRLEAREPDTAAAPAPSGAGDIAAAETITWDAFAAHIDEALADRAEALPIADAVAESASPPPKRSLAPVLVAAAVIAGGLLTLVLIKTERAPGAAAVAASPVDEPATSAPPAVQPVAALRVDSPGADRPRWSADARGAWLAPGHRGAAFEVASENTVGAWMRNVRPSLVVRCTGGRTEVFVFTQTPARIEPGTEDHTVTLGIDDGDETTELWPDSVEHDALFAPDGAALARRLLGARSMRFGFTPHNAAPAVARFHVEGLEGLLRPAARECGWR
jgi:hypothetical protein